MVMGFTRVNKKVEAYAPRRPAPPASPALSAGLDLKVVIPRQHSNSPPIMPSQVCPPVKMSYTAVSPKERLPVIKIKDNVYWVGVKDWEIRRFHGEEYTTHRGSTYNSYLIRDKKTVLVDTVWTPFHEGFVEDLEKDIGLGNISAVVVNHTEQDHAGSLAYLMEKIPRRPFTAPKTGL